MDYPKTFVLPPLRNPLDHLPPNPSCSRGNYVKNVNLFQEVDKHAIRITPGSVKTFTGLMWNLIYSRDCSELDKARIIFRWLTAHKVESVKFVDVPKDSPEELFVQFQTGETASMSRLYQLLSSYAGLQCVNILGIAKGENYLPGDMFDPHQCNHSWNAVNIDRTWYLVDVQWAARCCRNILNSDEEKVITDYDEFYFQMDPMNAIYSHFPHRTEWQLLPDHQQISLDQFQSYPAIKSQFFRTEMGFEGTPKGVMGTETGLLEFSILYAASADFVYNLEKMEGDVLSLTHEKYDVRSFAILENCMTDIVAHFRIPFKGNYIFSIFSKVISSREDLDSEIFQCACMFRIYSPYDHPEFEPYKIYLGTCFGPCKSILDAFNVEPLTHKRGLIPTSTSSRPAKVEVAFRRCNSHISLRGVVIGVGKINYRNTAVSQQPTLDSQQSDDKFTFTITLPEEGEYTFEVYAKNALTSSSHYTQVCQYLLDFRSKQPQEIQNTLMQFSPIQTWIDQLLPQTISPVESQPSKPLKPPKDFSMEVAEAVNENDLVLNEHLPCTQTESDFYGRSASEDQQKLLEQMDEDTLEVSQRSQDNVKDLMWQLIYSRNLTDEIDRIRAIFLWICTKNLDDLHLGVVEPHSAEEKLIMIKQGEFTYAKLFALLCTYANIKCVVVQGHVKGVLYVPGRPVDNTHLHSWNAAMVKGKWQLFDCQWASRRLSSWKSDVRTLKYNLDDFYYMPNPNHLKWTHFPKNAQWQLLTETISQKEFERLPPVKSTFFKYGIELLTHDNGYIECEEEIEMRISAARPLSELTFTFTLSEFTEPTEFNEAQKDDFSHFGLHYPDLQISQSLNVEVFRIRFPYLCGFYELVLYGRERKSNTYEALCEFRVKAVIESGYKGERPFPPITSNGYGPTDKTFEFSDWWRNCPPICVRINENENHIPLMISMDFMKVYTMKSVLRGIQLDEDTATKAIFHRFIAHPSEGEKRGDDSVNVVMTVFPPNAGEYALEVYLQDPNDKSHAYTLVWRFLLDCQKTIRQDSDLLKILSQTYLGPLPSFYQLGLAIDKHCDPVIYLPTLSLDNQPITYEKYSDIVFELGVRHNSDVFLVAQLSSLDEEGYEVKETNYVLQESHSDRVKFYVRIPRPGFYYLRLFGQCSSVEDLSTLPVIFTYALYCQDLQTPSQGAIQGPFPKQSNSWRRCASLNQPLSWKLNVTQPIPFSLKIPQAKDVAVVVDDEVFFMQPTAMGNDMTLWETVINIREMPHPKSIVVAARWSDEKSHFIQLLNYAVES